MVKSDVTHTCPHCQRNQAKAAKLEKKVKRLTAKIAKFSVNTAGNGVRKIFFNEKEVATRLGLSVKTLQNWRGLGKGPKFHKSGRMVRYRLRDILAWEKSLSTNGGLPE